MVHGINNLNHKDILLNALCKIPGVHELGVTITSAADTGKHPNAVVIRGAFDSDVVRQVIGSVGHGLSSVGS